MSSEGSQREVIYTTTDICCAKSSIWNCKQAIMSSTEFYIIALALLRRE